MQSLGQPEEHSRPPALRPQSMRVLILGRDRQFKRMARLLFERRGTSVSTGSDAAAAVQLARRHRVDVVVLDTTDAVTASVRAAASLVALADPIGVVLVSADGVAGNGHLAMLPKWGPFEDLFAEAGRVHPLSQQLVWSEDAAL